MAKTLTLRQVPDRVVRGLKQRALRSGRSMQAELLSIVEGAVVDHDSFEARARELRARARRRLKTNEIRAAISEGRS